MGEEGTGPFFREVFDPSTGCVRPPFAPELVRFYKRRYELFHNYDAGFRMDAGGWFSVTPEAIARRQAQRCGLTKRDLVVDGFAGCGGNVIQFAVYAGHVVAVDNDRLRITLAEHNARVRGVARAVSFIHANFMDGIAVDADVVFMSPPWGGLGYDRSTPFDPESLQPPASVLLRRARGLGAPRLVVLFLPRNVDQAVVRRLAAHGETVELRKEWLGRRLVAVTAFFKRRDRDWGRHADPKNGG